jgi:hypothetical protein
VAERERNVRVAAVAPSAGAKGEPDANRLHAADLKTDTCDRFENGSVLPFYSADFVNSDDADEACDLRRPCGRGNVPSGTL